MARKATTPLRRDHARSRHHPGALDPIIQRHLTTLVSPATYAVTDQYRRLGLRFRVLNLLIMVALILTLIWRQVPSVSELVRMLARDHQLWSPPHQVSQQALSLRLRSLPAALFGQVVHTILPQLQQRSAARSRPLPPVIQRAQQHFHHVWIADATKLEALFKKVGALRAAEDYPHGGTLLSLLDLPSKLPVHLVWDADAAKNERHLLNRVKEHLVPGTLLLLDRGF